MSARPPGINQGNRRGSRRPDGGMKIRKVATGRNRSVGSGKPPPQYGPAILRMSREAAPDSRHCSEVGADRDVGGSLSMRRTWRATSSLAGVNGWASKNQSIIACLGVGSERRSARQLLGRRLTAEPDLCAGVFVDYSDPVNLSKVSGNSGSSNGIQAICFGKCRSVRVKS
jgi:hypothetical protein